MDEGADADAEVRIPRSALGSVQRALARVHAAVGLHATLQAIAEGVTTSTPYTNVTVTTAREPDAMELHVEAVVGPPDAVAMLLGTTCRRAALLEHLAGGEAWGALRFWSHFGETDGVIMFVPDYEPLDVPDAWRPEYELMAPLYGPDGELIGTMSLDRPRNGRIPPPWTNEFLELFAEQAAIAILNARRHEQALRAMHTLERERAALHVAFAEQRARETDLHHQTRRDSLTGLANRVLLQERLEELLAAQIPLSVVFCDLDQFKRINDTHGHAVGDEVLRAMGARLARRLAAADVVARIGGDEFVVVAAGVRQQDAPGLLRRIEEAFARDPVRIGDLSLHLSSSLGLVCEPGGAGAWAGSAAERAEELLSNADRKMYAHKRSRAGVQRLLQLAESQPRSPGPDTDLALAPQRSLSRDSRPDIDEPGEMWSAGTAEEETDVSVREVRAAGLGALMLATELLQRARRADPRAGLWEAADVQWWWRKPLRSDEVEKLFWIDDEGPVAGVLLTSWTDDVWQCDPVVVPRASWPEPGTVWRRALEHAAKHSAKGFEVPVSDDDRTFQELAQRSGLTAGGHDSTAWMDAADRSAVSGPAEGFVLIDRTQRRDAPHPMRHRNGDSVAQRLEQCPLYDPALDLSVETADGRVAGYSLYWFDPKTKVGLIEPVRVEDDFQRQGLAQAMLSAGIDRLVTCGAQRMKISYETAAAASLYQGVGFQPTSTATWYRALPE